MKIYVIAVSQGDMLRKRVAGPFATQDAALEGRARYYEQRVTATERLEFEYVVTREEVRAARRRERGWVQEGLRRSVPTWFPRRPGDTLYASSKDGEVAYYSNDLQLVQNRLQRSSASRYLSGLNQPMRSEEVSALAQRYLAWQHNYSEMKITNDSGEIYSAYEDSRIRSCMLTGYGPERHPSLVYGGDSDLHLAIVRKDGAVQARCVVNVANKKYVAIYAACPAAHEHLAACLTQAGYVRDYYAFVGARINLVPHPHLGRCYVMAYIDGAVGQCDKDGIMCRGGVIFTQTTGGYAPMPQD